MAIERLELAKDSNARRRVKGFVGGVVDEFWMNSPDPKARRTVSTTTGRDWRR
jgi:hypothetical protein